MKTTNTAETPQTVVEAPKFPSDAELVAQGHDNLSKRIRALAAMGCKTGAIAKIVLRSNGEHPRYQHVRNVLNTPLKTVATA